MHSEGHEDFVTRGHSVFHGSGTSAERAKIDRVEVVDQGRPAYQIGIACEKTRNSFQDVGIELPRIVGISRDQHQDQAKVGFAVPAPDLPDCRLTETFPRAAARRAVVLPVPEDNTTFPSDLVDIDGLAQ
ncbi:hypothetical protein ATY75_03290 [Rhizobium sp. N122]|nr:hypothetical protein ATY75_03290 [Rhizobium sp. N122]